MTSQSIDLRQALARARQGGVAAGNLTPLSGVGNLRITYNWLYSALNCDPNDGSDFLWTINKIGSGSVVSLSPQQPFDGMTLYASVRPDLDYTVEVQAPGSADWITAVGSDEELTLVGCDLLIISFTGLNGSYLSVDTSQTSHDSHSGYLVHADASTAGPSSRFLFAVQTVLQPGLGLPLMHELDIRDVAAALDRQGAGDPDAMARDCMRAGQHAHRSR